MCCLPLAPISRIGTKYSQLVDNLIIGRGVVLFLACLLWGVFFTFYRVITLYRNDSAKRILFGILCLGASIGLLFSQLDVYTFITHIRKLIDDDGYFFWLVVLEWIIPGCALFLVLIRDRNRMPRGQ